MATIQSTAELAWRRINPNGGADAPNLLGEYIATAKILFATRMYYRAKEEKREDGEFTVPSYLMGRKELPVSSNKTDFSGLKIMKGLGGDDWLMLLESTKTNCPPEYSRFSLNTYRATLASQMGNFVPYYPLGKEIIYPAGTDDKNVFITYVSDGTDINEGMEIPDNVAGELLIDIYKFYTGKLPEDKSNNNNSNT